MPYCKIIKWGGLQVNELNVVIIMQNYNLPWDILIGYQKCIRLQIVGDTDSRVNNPAQIKGQGKVRY